MAARELACCCLTAVQTPSDTMRRHETSIVSHYDAGLSGETRLPVSGFLTYRRRLHSRRPTDNALFRMPVPRLSFPGIVLGSSGRPGDPSHLRGSAPCHPLRGVAGGELAEDPLHHRGLVGSIPVHLSSHDGPRIEAFSAVTFP